MPKPFFILLIVLILASLSCQVFNRVLTREQEKGTATPPALMTDHPDAGTESTLRLEGQVGGSSHGVAVNGSIAYLGVGPRVYVLDVKNPATPKKLGESAVLPGVVRSLIYSEGFLFVADDKGFLRVLEVTNPAQPVEVGALVENSYAQGLALEGDILCIADNAFGLRVVDVSNPRKPRKIGEVQVPGAASSVAIEQGMAYLAGSVVEGSDPSHPQNTGAGTTPAMGMRQGAASTVENGLAIIDLSNPAMPGVRAKIAIPDASGSVIYAVTAWNNRAYVAIGNGGVAVFDVSSPTQPTRAGTLQTTWTDGLVREGSHLFVSSIEGLYLFEISDPAYPRQTEFVPLEMFQQVVPTQRNMGVANGMVFLANGNQGMLTVQAIPQLQLVGRFDTPLPGAALDVVVNEGTAYVIADTLGLYSIDVRDAKQLEQLDFDTGGITGLRTPRGIAIAGDVAYVADINHGLSIYDISNPAVLTELSRVESPQGMTDVAVEGNYAFVTVEAHQKQNTRGMLVFDVSDARQPRQVGFCETEHNIYAVAVEHGLAYLPEMVEMAEKGEPASFYVFDVGNPGQPVERGRADSSLSAPGAMSIAVDGRYAYVGDHSLGLRVFDISEPSKPVEVGALPSIMMVLDLSVADGKVFTASYGFVGVVDVSNPRVPVLTEMFRTPGLSQGVDVQGTLVYVAGFDGGLILLQQGQ